MTNAISPNLATILNQEAEFSSWDNLEPSWQATLQQVLLQPNLDFQVICPHHITALQETVKYCYNQRLSIIVCGNTTKLAWGNPVSNIALVVSTKHLNQITEHAVEDLTVTVQSGVKLADLQQHLRQYNQFLPLDPSYPETATLGGIVATADAGSWRQRYGGVRDLLLGLSLIRSDGQIAKAGGKVVKNVAGYDLMKLITGSYGTLGVISELTFRVYPLPEASSTLMLTGEADNLNQVRQNLLNSSLTPTAVDILSSSLAEKLQLGKNMALIVRFQSIIESVREQISILSNLGQQFNLHSQTYSQEAETQLWQQICQQGRIPETTAHITAKIGLLPSSAIAFLNYLDHITFGTGLGIIHANSGLGYIQLVPETRIHNLAKLRAFCQEHQGFMTILNAKHSVKQQIEPWGYTGNALSIMHKIKQQFDPNHILNPNRFML